jgi:hypothetical protein
MQSVLGISSSLLCCKALHDTLVGYIAGSLANLESMCAMLTVDKVPGYGHTLMCSISKAAGFPYPQVHNRHVHASTGDLPYRGTF